MGRSGLADLVDYKEEILRDEKPNCVVQRIRLDLTDVTQRREVFSTLGATAKKILIFAQGLLVYLSPEEVASLARDLAAIPNFAFWVLDLVSPGLLRIMQKNMAQQLSKTGASFKFGPEQGPEFFSTYGWKAIDIRMPLKTAAKFKRVPLWMRMLAALPASTGKQGSRPWSGICLCTKI